MIINKLIDFHSHILPCIDHGSISLEMSLKQLRIAESFGVDAVVATSHFYPQAHDVDLFLQFRDKAYENLCAAASENGIKVEIFLGAEVLLCAGMNKLPNLSKLCLEGTNCLLLELPFSGFNEECLAAVENLIEDGYNVVLAHADRYDPLIIEQLVDVGAKIQLNACSLTGLFKRRILLDWIQRNLVVALGSDIHLLDKSAYRSFRSAAKRFGIIMKKTEALLIKNK